MTGIFKIALHLRDRHIFMWQSLEILNVFNTLTLKQIFWKTRALEYRLSVESTKIDNAKLPHNTSLSEANVKTNRMSNIYIEGPGTKTITIFLFSFVLAVKKRKRSQKNLCVKPLLRSAHFYFYWRPQKWLD